jgi:outer membrane receptor protein involved in Fe transport
MENMDRGRGRDGAGYGPREEAGLGYRAAAAGQPRPWWVDVFVHSARRDSARSTLASCDILPSGLPLTFAGSHSHGGRQTRPAPPPLGADHGGWSGTSGGGQTMFSGRGSRTRGRQRISTFHLSSPFSIESH